LMKLRKGSSKLLAARSPEFFEQKLKQGLGKKGAKAVSRINSIYPESEYKKRKLVVYDPIFFNWVFRLLISQLEGLKPNFEGATLNLFEWNR